MKFFSEDTAMRDFCAASEALEVSIFPDGIHGVCDYCGEKKPKWGMTFSLKTGKLHCGCRLEPNEPVATSDSNVDGTKGV